MSTLAAELRQKMDLFWDQIAVAEEQWFLACCHAALLPPWGPVHRDRIRLLCLRDGTKQVVIDGQCYGERTMTSNFPEPTFTVHFTVHHP